MFESKSGVLVVAGLGFFLLAFLSNGLVPWLMYAHLPEKTAEELVNRKVMVHFRDLEQRYPESFRRHFGTATEARCAEALREGRKVYVGEGCWHCHSQFVRPVSNESRRWGPVSAADEYQNELQRPVLFGTRRVGPDLVRESGRHSNDWHAVHFFRPRMTSPESVMPDYPWFFDGNSPNGPGTPNRRGLALITYMQWLGSWQDEDPSRRPDFHDHGGPR
jgi:cytochrome c oxidase cbb3-type subunit 2